MNEGYHQSRAFFEMRYQQDSDPWKFASSPYEQARYHATLAALRRSTYRRVYEPGCSVGVLTYALADRCGEVIATDISEAAVARARERCRGCANVHIEQGDVVTQAPGGTFDLIIFSEIGYYFSASRLGELAMALSTRLEAGGEFVAVNWLGDSTDHVLHGDQVYEVLNANLKGESLGGARHSGFRIDSWRGAS